MASEDQPASEQEIRAVQARMVFHCFDHLLGSLDARTASIIAKNQLLKAPPPSPIPEEFVELIEDPNHLRRVPTQHVAFIPYRETGKRLAVVEMRDALVNPEQRVRDAAFAELMRRDGSRERFLSPDTRRRAMELRDELRANDPHRSMQVGLEIADLLEEDYFFNCDGVRQCANLRILDELPAFLRRVLTPAESTINFLLNLPAWSPKRQKDQLEQMLISITDSSNSLEEVLTRYYRIFGHLPFASGASAADIVAMWCSRDQTPGDPWSEIWSWAETNGSPLARYHACQIFCHVPDFVPSSEATELRNKILDVLQGPLTAEYWQLRCRLARHYCRHLESVAHGVDGERVSACSWWLAEYLASTIDSFEEESREKCVAVINDAYKISDEVWVVARPPATPSSLRYTTLFSASMWATSLLCELSDSNVWQAIECDKQFAEAIASRLCRASYVGLGCTADRAERQYAFEGTTVPLMQHVAELGVDVQVAEKLTDLASLMERTRAESEFPELIEQLPTSDPTQGELIAHELRLAAFCGNVPSETLWKCLSDSEWRTMVLTGESQSLAELTCGALIEIELHDSTHDWSSFLPHFLALACEEALEEHGRKRLLFGYTVVSSLAVNAVSAVERLLKGDRRGEYEDFVAQWRIRIERMTPHAPAWIAAKLRGMNAVLHIG